MKFDPKNMQDKPDQEFKYNLLEPGVCDFYVLNAEDKTGPYGDYIELIIKAQDSSTSKATSEVRVFLPGDEKNMWRTQEFMNEIGEKQQFDSGSINVKSLIKKRGQCMIQHKEYRSKQDGLIKLSNHVASFLERNNIPQLWKLKEEAGTQVMDYSATKQGDQGDQGKQGAAEFQDDVPF